MASSRAPTVNAYLAALPPERRADLEAVRKVIRKNLPKGFEEGMQFGMIGYYLPLSRYPDTYNGQALSLAALAAQKNYSSVYLTCVNSDPASLRWFEQAYREAGKKLDMGKSCVRFRAVSDLALDVIGASLRRVSVDSFIAMYEAARGVPKTSGRQPGKASGKKPGKASGKKPPARSSAARNGTARPAPARPAPARATKPATARAAKPAPSRQARPGR